MKKILSLAALVCALSVPAFASTVSFLIIETGLPEDPSVRPQSSMLWENGLMDVFFDAGYIVSNAPMMRLARDPGDKLPDAARGEFNLAKEGDAAFFIVALLAYPDDGSVPAEVTLRIFSTAQGSLIYEQAYKGGAFKNPVDEFEAVKKTARTLVPNLAKK
jgi:hypothetical protein